MEGVGTHFCGWIVGKYKKSPSFLVDVWALHASLREYNKVIITIQDARELYSN